MIRSRRRFADIRFADIMTYLAVAVVSLLAISSWISNIHAAAPPPGESYLYNTGEESVPVLDHGLSGYDFIKSTSPKVVEFYDPTCGACQAFKYNYIEVAKKVQAQQPNVEFYGVSCEAYPSICDNYGGRSVPRIYAFPSGESTTVTAGIKVEKGAGVISFLSARLVKALRTPEEISSDGEKLLGNLEDSSRRLRDEDGSFEDDQVATESEDEDGEEEEAEDEDASQDQDAPEDEDEEEEDFHLPENEEDDESEDNGKSYSAQDIIDESQGSKNREEEESGDDIPAPPENKYIAKQGKRNKQVVSENGSPGEKESGDDIPASRGRYEEYMTQDRRNKQVKISGENKRPSGKKNEHFSKEETQDGQPPVKPQDAKELAEQRGIDTNSDAWRNTMRHFETEDIKRGKERGHHFQQWSEQREAMDRERKRVAEEAKGNFQSSPRQSVVGGGGLRQKEEDTPQGGERKSKIEPMQNNQRVTPPHQSGDPRQENEAAPQDQNQIAAPSSLQSDGGGGLRRQKEEDASEKDASEDPRYVKSAFGPNASANKPADASSHRPNFSDGREHSGPIPIGGAKQEQEDKPWVPPSPLRQHLPVGGDIFVPHPFNQDPVRAKKFQEYVARRKEALEKKNKMKHPIKSITKKKEEQLEEGEEKKGQDMTFVHKKVSPMSNYKAQHKGTKAGVRPPDLRPEAQHKTVGEKVLKKIPIVKQFVKRSKGEETLNDAALSFTRGLLMGVFKSNEALDYKRKAALLDWLDLLRVSLPPEIGLHELIDTLKYNIDDISQRHENLLLILDKHRLPDHVWSADCRKGAPSGGFFCGFWKLLHVMSVGVAEHAGGLAYRESSPSMRVFSAKEAGDVVREYMALFFNCEKCSKRFLSQYDDCSFQRCHRLSDETASAPAESWQEFPLWLWQVHNDVSRSKSNRAYDFHEKAGRKALAQQWEKDMSVVYPHIDQCLKCVNSDGTWDLNQVYNHLEIEYWTFGHEVSLDPKMEKFLEYNDIERKSVGHGLGAYVMISLMMLLTLVAKKQRIRATGRHKKVEAETLTQRFPKKYRDS